MQPDQSSLSKPHELTLFPELLLNVFRFLSDSLKFVFQMLNVTLVFRDRPERFGVRGLCRTGSINRQ